MHADDTINTCVIRASCKRLFDSAERERASREEQIFATIHGTIGAGPRGTEATAAAAANDVYGIFSRLTNERESWGPFARSTEVDVTQGHIDEMRLYLANETEAVVKMAHLTELLFDHLFSRAQIADEEEEEEEEGIDTPSSPAHTGRCGHSRGRPASPPPRNAWDFHLAAAAARELRMALDDLRVLYLGAEFIQKVVNGVFAERYKQRIESRQREQTWTRDPPPFKPADVLTSSPGGGVCKKKKKKKKNGASLRRHFA
jgi:hypothetical protein